MCPSSGCVPRCTIVGRSDLVQRDMHNERNQSLPFSRENASRFWIDWRYGFDRSIRAQNSLGLKRALGAQRESFLSCLSRGRASGRSQRPGDWNDRAGRRKPSLAFLMGQVSRKCWAMVSEEERNERGDGMPDQMPLAGSFWNSNRKRAQEIWPAMQRQRFESVALPPQLELKLNHRF